MHHTCFELGSQKTKGTGIGKKAHYLDTAAGSRLNVPRGLIVRGEARLEALLLGLLDEHPETSQITCSRPQALADWLNFPTFSSLVTVHSAFGIEDDPDQPYQGVFSTVLHVNLNDPADIASALCTVWSSAAAVEGDYRKDILIMEMIPAQKRGIAFSQHDYADDLVNVVTGESGALLAHQEPDEIHFIPQLWRAERQPDARLEDWEQRLQVLLRQMRSVFGQKDWMIEWADDGKQCYLLHIQASNQIPQRNEIFARINHREWLVQAEGLFFADLVASCSERFLKQYRRFDPALPESRPLIEVFHAQPYLNISLLADMLRKLGLSTQYLPAIPEHYPRKFLRLLLKTLSGVLPRMMFSRLREGKSIVAAQEKINARLQNPGETWEELIVTARWLYITYVVALGTYPPMAPLLTDPSKSNRIRADWRKQIAQALESIWQLMLEKADELVEQGILPQRDAIWWLTISELCEFDAGWQPENDFFVQRQARIKAQSSQFAPELVHSLDDWMTIDGKHSLSGTRLTRPMDEAEEPAFETLYDFSANRQIRIASGDLRQ